MFVHIKINHLVIVLILQCGLINIHCFSLFASQLLSGKDTSEPVSGFEYSGIGVGISAGRQFFFKASSLTLGLEAGADKSLSGSYSYQGARAESRPVKEWYPHDLAVLSSDRIRAGFKGDYIQGIRHGMSLGISLQLSYLTPLVPKNSMDDLGSRLGSRLSLSIFF